MSQNSTYFSLPNIINVFLLTIFKILLKKKAQKSFYTKKDTLKGTSLQISTASFQAHS